MGLFNTKKASYAKVCPKCKSLNIKTELRSGWFIGLPPAFKCQDCGFKSKFFPEVEIDANNLKEKEVK